MDRADLERRIDEALVRDRRILRERLRRLRGGDRPARRRLEASIARSCAARAARAARLPAPEFPPDLPITAQRLAIAAAVERHPVVVVRGETGSGKTTQLPKICLAAGRGAAGWIGHTQPRRIAARSVAARIARELSGRVGEAVGSKVRFRDEVGPDTYVKVMTDGILVAEIGKDRLLEAYDTLILDEAHERSLNIDLLLGHVKEVLAHRPDLRVIVSSATLDTQRISDFFGDAPVIDVSGRTYPVEVRHVEAGCAPEDPVAAVPEAVRSVAKEGPGDILVFLPGERDIREAARALRADRAFEVLPLYARLNHTQQERIFRPGERRRVVLATNVAETSLTVPRIRFVVDTGLARISRYSYRTRVQRLPVEPVSRASAEQRRGRCGRLGPGTCVRLYSREDFEGRPRFTSPEVRRTNLASVILRMAASGLGRIDEFAFIDPPDRRFVTDGYRLLRELGAFDAEDRVTGIGRRIARLPVDPRIGRMILAAGELDCVAEILVIAAALSAGDPRESPPEGGGPASAAHRRFADPRSDFMGYLNLWRFLNDEGRRLRSAAWRRRCQELFLSPRRVREWRDVHRQLLVAAREMGLRPAPRSATYAQIHRAVLAGCVAHVGVRAQGARIPRPAGSDLRAVTGLVRQAGRRALDRGRGPRGDLDGLRPRGGPNPPPVDRAVRPGTRHPRVLRAAFRPGAGRSDGAGARGPVRPYRRAPPAGPVRSGGPRRRAHDLHIGGPRERRSRHGGCVRAAQPGDAREDAGDRNDGPGGRISWSATKPAPASSKPGFPRKSRANAASGAGMTRRPIRSASASRSAIWSGPEPGCRPRGSFRTRSRCRGSLSRSPTASRRRTRTTGSRPGSRPRCSEPSRPSDSNGSCPAAGEEKAVALLRTLPRPIRRRIVPLRDTARRCLAWPGLPANGFAAALAAALHEIAGVEVGAADFRPDLVPGHLRMRFEVIGAHGQVLGNGRDLDELKGRFHAEAARSFTRAAERTFEREGLTTWCFGDLPDHVDAVHAGVRFRGYPALEDRGSSVALRLFDAPRRAAAVHRGGVARLAMLRLGRELRSVRRALGRTERLALRYFPAPASPWTGSGPAAGRPAGRPAGDLVEELLARAVAECCLEDGSGVRGRSEFERRIDSGAPRLESAALALRDLADRILGAWEEARGARAAVESRSYPESLADFDEHLAFLVYRGFLADTPLERLAELPRYLEAARGRLAKLPATPLGTSNRPGSCVRCGRRSGTSCAHSRAPASRSTLPASSAGGCWRSSGVSQFMQEMGTRHPVSVQRIERAWAGRPVPSPRRAPGPGGPRSLRAPASGRDSGSSRGGRARG